MTKNSPTKNTTTSSNTNSNTNNTNTNTTYIKLKTRLEKLGYTHPFDPNSIELILCLLNDLCQTTETCRSLKYTHSNNTKHIHSGNGNNEVEVLNHELKNLIIENTQLHKDLIQHSELKDQREKEIMKMVRGYESEIGELKFMNQMYLKKVEELRLGSERERVEMGRVLNTINTTTTATVINTTTGMEISKGLEPITTTPYNNTQIEKEMYIGDLLKIQQNQLDHLTNENLDLQKRNTDLNEQLEQLFNQVELRNEEITRLGSLLHGTATTYTAGTNGGVGQDGDGININLLQRRNEELSHQISYLYESIADLELQLDTLHTEKSQLIQKSERELEGLKEEIEGYKRREGDLKRDLGRMEKFVKELEGRKGYSIGARGATGIRKSSSSGGDKKVGGSAIPVKKQVLREKSTTATKTTTQNNKTTTTTTKTEQSIKEWKEKYHTLEKELQIAIQRVSFLERQNTLSGTTTATTAGNTAAVTTGSTTSGNSFKETYNNNIQLYKHISTQTNSTPSDATRDVKEETGSGKDVSVQTLLEMSELKEIGEVREMLRNEELRVRELEEQCEQYKLQYEQLELKYEQYKEKEEKEKEKEMEKEKVEERIMELEETISDLRCKLDHSQQQQLQRQTLDKLHSQSLKQSQSLEQSQQIQRQSLDIQQSQSREEEQSQLQSLELTPDKQQLQSPLEEQQSQSESMYTFSEQQSFKQLNTDHSPSSVTPTDRNTTPTYNEEVVQMGNTKETLYTQNTQHTTSEIQNQDQNQNHKHNDQKEYIHKLESEINTLNKTIIHLQSEVEEWKNKVLKMDEERDGYIHELDQSAEEIQRLKGEIMFLKAVSQSGSGGSSKGVGGIGNRWEEIRKLEGQVEEEKRKGRELRMKYDSVVLKMRMIEHRNSDLEREYHTLFKQNQELNEECTRKDTVIKERDTQLSRKEEECLEMGEEVERVRKEKREKEREFGECYGRLMESIHERQLVEIEIGKVKTLLTTTEQEKSVLQKEYELLMSRVRGSEKRIKELEMEVEEYKKEILEQSQQILLLKQEIEESQQQLRHTQDSETHSKYILTQLSQKNNELEKQMAYCKLEMERMEKALETMMRERDRLRREVEELRGQCLSLEKVLEGERRKYALTGATAGTVGGGSGGASVGAAVGVSSGGTSTGNVSRPEPSAPVLPLTTTEQYTTEQHGIGMSSRTVEHREYLKEEWRVLNPSAPPLLPLIPHSQPIVGEVNEIKEEKTETGKEKEVVNGEMKKLPIAKSLGQIIPTGTTTTTTTTTIPITTATSSTPATTTTTGKTETKSTTAQVQTEMIKSLAEYSQTEHHTIAKYVQTDDRDTTARGTRTVGTVSVVEKGGNKERVERVETVEKQTGMTPSSTSTTSSHTTSSNNNNRSPPLINPKQPSEDDGIQEWTPERNRSKVEERIMSELRHTKQQLKRFENMIEQRFTVHTTEVPTTTQATTALPTTTAKPNTTTYNDKEEDSTTGIGNEESSDLALELLKTWKAQNEAMRRELLSIPTAYPELLRHLRSTAGTTSPAGNNTAKSGSDNEAGRRAEEENELMMRVIQEVARDLKQVTP